ncbi:MAG: hypothetical protein EA384_07415 [Spirochaetaceae bacterium]|nr:MAG: hypothetical protein EA384_07415 [Spirochaetaceae bacterium]
MFCETDPATLNVDPEDLRQRRTQRTPTVLSTWAGVKRVYYENSIVYDEAQTGVLLGRLIEMRQTERALVRGDRYPLLQIQPCFVERGRNFQRVRYTSGVLPQYRSTRAEDVTQVGLSCKRYRKRRQPRQRWKPQGYRLCAQCRILSWQS